MKYTIYLVLFILTMCFSCGEDVVPKPKAYLRLDYPDAKYVKSTLDLPFSFENNMLATKISSKEVIASIY